MADCRNVSIDIVPLWGSLARRASISIENVTSRNAAHNMVKAE